MRVEIHLIGGDIYVNNRKIIFAVPFNPENPTTEQEHGKYKTYTSVDWLIAWAKVGLLSQGHTVPDFPMGPIENFHAVEPHLEVQNGERETGIRTESSEPHSERTVP